MHAVQDLCNSIRLMDAQHKPKPHPVSQMSQNPNPEPPECIFIATNRLTDGALAPA